ncbi:MFS transporter [Micropruina sp.]|uniref:MFS transporter n=1 Tax=Micropruina sp. TaxID=2737536 RepID=UPI0039E6C014
MSASHSSADVADHLQPPTPPGMEPFRLNGFQRNKLFFSLMIGFFLIFVCYASVGAVFLPAALSELDEANKENNLAAIMSLTAVFTMFVQPIVGAVSDRTRSRFGRRTPWMVLGGLSGGTIVILMQFANTFAYLAICAILVQVLLNIMQGPISTIIADRVSFNHRAFGSSWVGVGQALGISGGMALAGNLINQMGVGYTLFGSTMIVVTLLFVVLNKDKDSTGLVRDAFSWKEFGLGFVRPLNFRKHPDFVWAFGGRFFMVLGYQAIQAYGLYILTDYIGLPITDAGQVLGIMSILTMITMMISTVLFGRLSDSTGRRKIFVFGSSALMAIAIAVPMVVPTTMSMYIYAFLVGIGYGAYTSVDLALMIDVLPSSGTIGKDLGVLNLASNIPQILVPILAAFLITLFGNYVVIFVYAIVGVIVSSLLVFPIKSVK